MTCPTCRGDGAVKTETVCGVEHATIRTGFRSTGWQGYRPCPQCGGKATVPDEAPRARALHP